MTDDHSYDDIIDQPHHTSRSRRPMPLHSRAAQFAPFAALAGYEGMVTETARITDLRPEDDEDSLRMLDQQLHAMLAAAQEQPAVTLVVFEPDSRKEGGAYQTITGRVRRVDGVNREIILTDRTVVKMDQVCAMRMGEEAE